MHLFYNNREAQKKKDLIETINSLMRISIDGLSILFATEDNYNKPFWKNDYDEKFNLQGFYINLKIENGFISDSNPTEVEECILGKSWNHFIWISRGICEAEDIHFAWVYTHELQHLKQNLTNPYLLILTDLLDHDRTMDEIPELDVPTEFDCEKKAKEVVFSIFGEDNCNSYLIKMRADSPANDKRYSKLLKINITVDFDVEQQMQQDICTKKERLKGIQKQMETNNRTKWNINIDKLCSCRNSHNAIISAVTRIP